MECNFNPKVSIIIPVYNGSKYLREAIDSAIGQTYSNIEVIVVNDGSNDNNATENIALSYGERVRYFYKDNGGVSTALNFGIEKMTGEYFSWLSHDDVYYPEKIERQIKYLVDSGLEDIILYGGYDLINEASEVYHQLKPDSLYSEEQLNISLFPLMKGLINGCTLLIHKSHFIKAGRFDQDLVLAQDYDLWFKIFRNARVRFVPGIFVKTRIHNEQQSSAKKELYIEEGNNLWISMINNVTIEEMCKIDGSPYLFYKNIADFLKRYTQYSAAQKHAEFLAKQTKGKVSIIIPFFNRIPLLLEAIESVLSQTYTNIEVLLVDDGSTDDITPVKAIKDPRLRLVQQEHAGVSAARNLGISLSSGEYIAFLDSDDILLPGKIEKQIKYMEKQNLYFSHTSYQRMNMTGRPIKIVNSGSFSGNVFPRILVSCGIATSTVMIKREILNNRKFKETIDLGEDVCLWIDIAYSFPIGGIDEPLTKVRVGTATSAFSVEKQRIAYLNIIDHVVKNPLYICNVNEIHYLIRDFSYLFRPAQNYQDSQNYLDSRNSQNYAKTIAERIRTKARNFLRQ